MMFSNLPHCYYKKNPIAEVICQLRFPEILTIGANAPVDFQEAIRDDFPRYTVIQERPAPKLVGGPNNPTIQTQESIKNYQFMSEDGLWRINLTSTFISLACRKYTSWEEFARHLDKPLAAFIRIYHPAFYERVGLRYVNFISRNALGLEHIPFKDLFQPAYIGLLNEDDLVEKTFTRNALDVECTIRNGCRAKIHAGIGIVKKNGQTSNEVTFIFDQDLYMSGNVPINHSAAALQTLHSQAFPIFRGAITETLHEALEPHCIY